MRKIDLHCYPGTAPWIASQGPYVEALATYWNKPWVAKDENDVASEVEALGIEAVLVAFDIESVTHTPPCSNAYVAQYVLDYKPRGGRPGQSTRVMQRNCARHFLAAVEVLALVLI